MISPVADLLTPEAVEGKVITNQQNETCSAPTIYLQYVAGLL